MCNDTGASKDALNPERRNRDQFVRTTEGREPHDDVQQCQRATRCLAWLLGCCIGSVEVDDSESGKLPHLRAARRWMAIKQIRKTSLSR